MNQFQSFGEVLSAVRRRAWLILLVTFVGCLASLTYALSQIKAYEATAVVQIEDARVPDRLAGAGTDQGGGLRRVQLIEQRLMARDNLVRIMETHDLFADDPTMTMKQRVFRMRQAARIEEIINNANQFAPGGNAPSGLRIVVSLADPQKAADVANELMQSVIEQSRSRSAGSARETVDFFVSEEARVGAEIESLAEEIAAFKRENAEQLPAGAADLRSQLASLREADLDLDREIVAMQTSAARQREAVTERQVALLQEQKRLIAERIASHEALIAGAPEVEREMNRLEREMTQLQEQYTIITRRRAEARMGQMLEDRRATDRFEVLETALVPEYPVSRSRKKMAIMGGLASVIAGLAVAVVVELMNPTLRTAAQMERALGVQPVVAIPTVARPRDRSRRGLTALAFLAATLASLWAMLRHAGLSAIEMAGRLMPRLSGN